MPRSPVFAVLAVVLITLVLLLSGCAPGNERFLPDDPAGFWFGLWHGCISLITLIIGIWSDRVHIYEAHNTGGWYDFGFLLGVALAWSSVGRRSERRWRRQREEEKRRAKEEE